MGPGWAEFRQQDGTTLPPVMGPRQNSSRTPASLGGAATLTLPYVIL
jgi:hypothetical protein